MKRKKQTPGRPTIEGERGLHLTLYLLPSQVKAARRAGQGDVRAGVKKILAQAAGRDASDG